QRLAADRLGRLMARDALPALEAVLRDNQNPEVRRQAAEALAQVAGGQKTVVPSLVAAMQSDGSPQVRARVARALSRHGLAGHAVDELIRVLQSDTDSLVRASAAAALRAVDAKANGVV